MIAVLLLAALSVGADVFPEHMCENLPEVTPEVRAWVAHVAPELAEVSVRELPEQTALEIFDRAAAAGWGSVDLLTNRVFREPCTFYFSGSSLRAVDAAFVLDLVTVIQGQDKKGQDFGMTALLAGRGKLVAVYDRDGIVYRNQRLARDFKLASRVEFETLTAGVLENVEGLCAKIRLLGCVRIRSLMKVGATLKVEAGTFTSETPLTPIQARTDCHCHGATRRGADSFIISRSQTVGRRASTLGDGLLDGGVDLRIGRHHARVLGADLLESRGLEVEVPECIPTQQIEAALRAE
jgi:hypothetical protein